MSTKDKGDPNDAIREEAKKLLSAEREKIDKADLKHPVLPSVLKNPLGAASKVLERFFTKDGLYQFAYWRENWYSYYKQLWSQRTDDDVSHFLHNKLVLCRSIDKEGDIIDFNPAQRNTNEIQYQIQQLVSIPSHYRAPVAYINGKWEPQDARGKIVCRGQIVDMITGEIADNHHLFIPNGAEWVYSPDAKPAKLWLKFLNDLFGDKDDEILLLQEWIGYLLSGDTWAHKGMIMVGPPRAGKGTIGHIISHLMGKSMVSSPSLHSLGKDFGLESLLDKRLCLISDARLSSRADAMAVIEVLLRITAGDAVDVGRKHKSSLQSELDVRVMMLSNEMPQLSDSSIAINTRFLILSLNNSFLNKEDTKLKEKLLKELPSIALWAVEGYRRLLKRGHFVEPESSNIARGEWYQENNPVSQFVEDRIELDTEARTKVTDVYEAYKMYCEANGIFAITSNALSRQLASQLLGKIRRTKTGSLRFFVGMRLRGGDF